MTTRKDNMIHDYPRSTPLYRDLIKTTTRCSDEEVGAVEQIMRDILGTLDGVSRNEFRKEARAAYADLQAMAGEEA
jgi:hypothetical protein